MTKNNLLTEQLRYTGENKFPTKINLCSYKKESITYHKDIEFEHLRELMNEDEINWIQVTGMQDIEKVKNVCQMFEIDFLTTQDILNPNHLTKIEEHDDYNVLIIKLLTMSKDKDYEPMQLCIIQGKSYVLTFAEKETDFFNDIISALNKNTLKIEDTSPPVGLSAKCDTEQLHGKLHVRADNHGRRAGGYGRSPNSSPQSGRAGNRKHTEIQKKLPYHKEMHLPDEGAYKQALPCRQRTPERTATPVLQRCERPSAIRTSDNGKLS